MVPVFSVVDGRTGEPVARRASAAAAVAHARSRALLLGVPVSVFVVVEGVWF